MKLSSILLSSLAATLVSCTAADKPAATADTAGDSPAAPGAPAAADPAPTPPANWAVTEKGIGPIHGGMSLDETNVILNDAIKLPANQECDYVRPANAPKGVSFMVVNGNVVRVDVTEGSPVTTSAGAGIGDTEEKIKSLYAGQVSSQPHKYTDGRYLLVIPKNRTDSIYRIVFETDGKKVLRYRAGIRPNVEWIEGCS